MKRIFWAVAFLLLLPFVSARSCGWTNLSSCLPEIIYGYFLKIINAPILPMLSGIQSLLTANIQIDIFQHLWSLIRYLVSFFYLFLIIYAGYTLLLANADPIKRAHAKDLLKNLIIMIILIQSSFYIYGLFLEVSYKINTALLTLIDPRFFLFTADNIVNIGLQFIFGIAYAITLFFTLLFLTLRFIVISIGVVFLPIALFLYFFPPLKGYGKFMLNLLGIFLFITTLDLIIIMACSKLLNVSLFQYFKILLMIACFLVVNYTLWLAVKFALRRSANASLKDDLAQAIKYITLL